MTKTKYRKGTFVRGKIRSKIVLTDKEILKGIKRRIKEEKKK